MLEDEKQEILILKIINCVLSNFKCINICCEGIELSIVFTIVKKIPKLWVKVKWSSFQGFNFQMK